MPKLHSLAALLAASVALAAAAPSLAAPVTVNLRIEGASQTLYEGPITTDARNITTSSGGTHDCNGQNQGAANPIGGTPTTAAYDGAVAKNLAFDALWFGSQNDPSSGDFFINQISSDRMADDFSGPTWNWWSNYQYGMIGGCQLVLQNGDDVLWDFGSYDLSALRLSGAPTRAATNEQFTVTVDQFDTSGNRTSAEGASVAGATTDASGHAAVAFADAGNHTFKATKSGTVRSNAATICVYVPGSGDCGTDKAQSAPTTESTPEPQPAPAVKDTTPPTIQVSLTPGKTYSSGPRVLAGQADDAGGIVQVFLRLRATDGGDLTAASRCRWFSGKRGVFTHRTVPCSKARFFRLGSNPKFSYLLPSRLGKGKYVLDVKVLDRAYNAGRMAVPFNVK
jgi:hypothetical protein